ncbi:hypothetical protein AM2010_1668 [Pelagerythrobacter marensis]|uniref:Uncharacterized protein n=1 Tax=Pelagerythrobacter marensis TaxID=543877 RepID=A0A0G3X854_9SPHN|nr:hypothetical protein [Pelagerythrobacter marensis]AKM07735.1 hypothetical protein AM2010_1668 [Pelagerythrobacter marensis]
MLKKRELERLARLDRPQRSIGFFKNKLARAFGSCVEIDDPDRFAVREMQDEVAAVPDHFGHIFPLEREFYDSRPVKSNAAFLDSANFTSCFVVKFCRHALTPIARGTSGIKNTAL